MSELPWPRWIGMKHIKEHILENDLTLSYGGNGFLAPKGTTIKLWQGQNFGYVLIPEDIAPNGQRIFRH